MLKNEISTLWKAIDNIILEGKKLSPRNQELYNMAKKELIKESYVIRRILGETKEALTEATVVGNPKDLVSKSKNILVALSRKNKNLAEIVLKEDTKTKKLLQIESLMFGDCIFNILDESSRPKYSIGLTLAESVFDAAAKKMLDLSESID